MPGRPAGMGLRARSRWIGVVLALVVLPYATAAPAGSGDLFGDLGVHRTAEDETLLDVARNHGLGFVELLAANPGVDPWLPGVGRDVLLPTAHLLPQAPRRGIVINLAEPRLYLFADDGMPRATFPLGIGRSGWETPTGETRIVAKRRDPVWVPPESICQERPELPSAIQPGPGNPLGAYALNLGWEGFVIHGTNKPYGIGRRVSHGCIRLYPEDITRLFDMVEVGMPVRVLDQPIKIGWFEGELYLEAHPTQVQIDELEAHGTLTPAPIPDLEDRIRLRAENQADRVDWVRAAKAVQERRGVPVRLTGL